MPVVGYEHLFINHLSSIIDKLQTKLLTVSYIYRYTVSFDEA
jgi:hypothetical protein